MKAATIILNRNLPDVTDALYEHLQRHDGDLTDIYVVEAGSDADKLSRYATWHATWPEAREKGLRYNRGMNYGLSELWQKGDFAEYDAFFLLTNDTELAPRPTLAPLFDVLARHPRVGILSPCSIKWGECKLLQHTDTLYFWFIHNNAYLLRRQFVEMVCDTEHPDHMNFLFDGDNFRGYGSESELIAKAYANNWAAAITRLVEAGENERHLVEKAALIKTESYADNMLLYLEEGKRWMHAKYGFNSRWVLQQYVKHFYDDFFVFNPELSVYKL
jgi:hypothetical protein